MELILAKNLQALMDANPLLNTQEAVAAAAKKAGMPINQKTVSRALNADNAVQLNTLQALAAAFGVEPYQLLVPDLNPKNPQILKVLSAKEEQFYKMLEEMSKPDSDPHTN